MTVQSTARLWLTPIAALTFLVVLVTGVLMLLHVHSGPIRFLHEWVSVVFALTGAAHVWLNWRGFMGILRQRVGVVALVSTCVVCVVLTLLGALSGDKGHHGRPEGQNGRGTASHSGQ